MSASSKDTLMGLIKQRDELEQKIAALQKNTFNGSLVDDEGFPRADIDVHATRNVRSELAHLQTDHKALMRQIEEAMLAYHQQLKLSKPVAKSVQSTPTSQEPKPAVSPVSNSNSTTSSASIVASPSVSTSSSSPIPTSSISSVSSSPASSSSSRAPAKEQKQSSMPSVSNPLNAFYLVDKIFENSPANICGLKTGDKILQFGSVVKSNKTPKAVQDVVANSVGRPVKVTVYRVGEGIKEVYLTPQKWEGKGMLGCHLLDV